MGNLHVTNVMDTFRFLDTMPELRVPKTQENIAVSDITDWTFAKKANEELKR
jgi:hypothetical protein